MYHKVRITKLPGKARGGKINGNRIVPNQSLSFGGADMKSGPKDISVANTISAVPRNQANLEAEGGETVYGDINGDGMAEHLVIKGPRHSSGGVPLNLPDDTFIFSDTRSMRLKDPSMLAQFGKTVKKGQSYTPAELAKQYDLSKYRKMLQDPESGDLERKTAEIMIRNYTMKLGALALAQESKKGFPQGIPEVARPYMEANQIKDEDLIPELAQEQSPEEEGAEQGEEQNPQEEMMEAPEQMPNGEQVAMPQEMQQPMAQYGYQMTSDTMPFNPGYMYPEYESYEQIPTQYARGGSLYKAQNGEVVEPSSFEIPEGVTPMVKGDMNDFFNHVTDNEEVNTLFQNNRNFNINAPQIDRRKLESEAWYKNFDTQPKTWGQTENPQWNAPYTTRPLDTIYANGGSLPKAQDGAATPPYGMDEAYTPKGVVRLNQYRVKYGLEPIGGKGKPLTKADIKKAAGEMQQVIIEKNPELVLHYIQNKSHAPSNAIKQKLGVKTNADIAKKLKEGKIKASDITSAYKDDQWWYRAIDTQSKTLSKADYEAKMKQEDAILQGDKKYFSEDPNNPEMYTEYTMAEDAPIVTEEKDAEVIDRGGDAEELDIAEAPRNVDAQWMTPDKINFYGAMKDKSRIKKFMPWAPRTELEVPTMTYLDPTRELGQQSEYANLMAQQLGQFTGPQAFASNMSGIQGTGAEQAANTLSRINNANVSASNQFAQNASNIRNQEQGINQAAAQKLYDQNTMANQQFLNAKIAADQNVRQAFGTGWKNASNLALTNALYPQYDIDPRSGNVWFQGGKDAVPTYSNNIAERASELVSQGWDQKIAYQMAKDEYGQGNGAASVDMDQIMDNTAKKGGQMNMGYVMGSNVFPFMFY